MVDDAPVVKLTNAILLSAIKQGAEAIRVRPATPEQCVVEFVIDGAMREELRPPQQLLGPIVRRLSIMASLPEYGRGAAAEGFIHLIRGGGRHAYFKIRVDGHGADVLARLRVIPAAEMPGVAR